MEIVFSIFFSFVPLLLIGLVVWGIVSMSRRHEEELEPGIGTVRRLFLYGGAAVGVFMAASGVSLLLGGLVDLIGPGDIVIGQEDTGLALGLSLTIVGTPVWWLFWWAGERAVRDHPVELRSMARRGQRNVVRAVALVVVVLNGLEAVSALLRLQEFSGSPWGWALAYGAVWALHDRWLAEAPAPTEDTLFLDRLYTYFGSALGLALVAPGVGTVLYQTLREAYDSAFVDSVVARAGWWRLVREGLVPIAVGLPIWWWHWLRQALHDAGTTLWRTYLFILGVLSGVVAALVGTGVLVWLVLAWVLNAVDGPASEHFDTTPAALSAVVVGVAMWAYHRVTLRAHTGAGAERTEPERVYRYLMTAAGLVTLAAGLVVVFAVGVEALTPNADVVHEGGWWRAWVARALTFLLMGAPLWGWFWLDVQRQAARASVAERLATSRRVFVFAVAGISALVAAVNLVIVLFKILEAVLNGTLTQDTIFDVRWSIGLLLTTGAIGVYYWLVLIEDRRELAEAAPVVERARGKLVLLVGPEAASADLARRLEELGDRVRRWQRLDVGEPTARLSDEQVAALHERVASAVGEQAMVLLGSDGEPEVVAYESR